MHIFDTPEAGLVGSTNVTASKLLTQIPMPSTLTRDISPPPRLSKRRKTSEAAASASNAQRNENDVPSFTAEPRLAAVEAGRTKIEAHLAYFKERLSQICRAPGKDMALISIEDWTSLYEASEHEYGNHFVVHQHNHPISGVHYDLRLQFSKSSSMSFAVPKGLPGNPNSKSLGRMAIETRVHNLWNHLIEAASARTGSLLIWDTGTYKVLPRKKSMEGPSSPQTTDDDSDTDAKVTASKPPNTEAENTKLIEAFQSRYIRLRLNGVRLPKNYTITLRLPSANDFGKPWQAPKRRQRSLKASNAAQSNDSEVEEGVGEADVAQEEVQDDIDTDEEDAQTRLNNAYPGSINSIGSVHQRKWFILLDRASSGFIQEKETGKWVRRGSKDGEGFEPFLVRGREFERSVVTARLARQVENDEGMQGYVGRSGWIGITR
ncbi:hypothetical protein BU23DRAFT_553366 [Bimuria novae-zelandiae CBS 107.79]|uniref:DNA ligase D 3'-phosphoesterase domain-containing protein n=1 Tax=Bimuria novae-zelandiae CBS 107.79 TaxID=1447943 RepID=A0A6A5VAY8_9PLEO|nr:hypothetical protein BU23DRAFT_553366 [Bimuria novae-zelandiae CBS 107.79]